MGGAITTQAACQPMIFLGHPWERNECHTFVFDSFFDRSFILPVGHSAQIPQSLKE